MTSLNEIQLDFYNALFSNDEVILSFIASSNSTERFKVYQNTIIENLINALKITYPGIWQLLGETCAHSVAYLFLKDSANFPTTACLDDWGSTYPSFLETLPQLSALPYLNDYACYEWARHLCYCADDTESVDLQKWTLLDDANIKSVKVQLKPSATLYQSTYPIQAITQLLEDKNADPIYLKQQATYGILSRLQGRVMVDWINEDLWHFLKMLEQKKYLDQAVDKVNEDYPNFDLVKAIQYLIERHLVSQICLK